MDALLPYVVVLGCLALAMGLFTWFARLIRRPGSAGGGLGAAPAACGEAFRTTGHASHDEVRAQADRKDPLESPDRWRRRPRKRA